MPAAAKPAAVVAGVTEVLDEITSAVSNPKTVSVDAVAFVVSAAGVAASLGFISDQTDSVAAAAAAVIIPAVARLVAAIRAHGHARVQAAAIEAKASK